MGWQWSPFQGQRRIELRFDRMGRVAALTAHLAEQNQTETFAFDATGIHYKYDERGNLVHRLQNGAHAHFTWDLFDRLASYSDDKLKVDYSYDALGRRLHKHSVAHYWDRPEAGTGWNQMQRAKRQRDLGCGFTLFGWDGDTLAWESSPPRDDGDTGRTVHYLYEPGSFVPVAQALRKRPIVLHRQPDWRQREYDFDQDPLWQTTMPPQAFDAIAWYHCDHLGTPMELTDPHGNVAWAGQYKAWGEVREERSEWAKQHGLGNPIRFQGQYHDHETGLHYNRHRYYDTRGARFICKDPISYAGGLNQYVYAPNPTSWIDQLGLAKESCCGPKATDVVDQTAGSIKNVNPGYPEAGRTHNCVNCSITTDATLAGNPASALPINHTKGVPLSILEKQFSSKFGPVIAPENIAQQMASSGNGARGIVFGSYGPGQPGHVFNVINQNGVVRFLDGQTGKPANLSNFKTLQLLRTN